MEVSLDLREKEEEVVAAAAEFCLEAAFLREMTGLLSTAGKMRGRELPVWERVLSRGMAGVGIPERVWFLVTGFVCAAMAVRWYSHIVDEVSSGVRASLAEMREQLTTLPQIRQPLLSARHDRRVKSMEMELMG